MRFLIFHILSTLLAFAWVVPAHAQVIDLYSRMTDPRGIARLNTPDTATTKAECFMGGSGLPLDSDGIPDVARDTGSGVITHIWSAASIVDTQATLWLYLNDTLYITGFYNEFFTTLRGLFRPPLDTSAHSANIWDVQIPYHKGFRLAMRTSNGNMYFAVEWHWVPDSVLPWFSLLSHAIPSTQIAAEAAIFDSISPWHDSNAVVLSRSDSIPAQTTVTLAEIAGPGMLESLHFVPSSYDSTVLDSTWLNIYWDKSPYPAVHVPLMDFFLSPVEVTRVRALQLKADQDSGFLSYFPMPFAVQARVELERTGSTPLQIFSSVQFHREPIDKNAYAYFHADFSESNPTKYHVWHPVIHTVGLGRYIGFGWGVMGHPFQEFLEGNPRFQIDSEAAHFIEYTGAEDYFDAAWWFNTGMFTVPFAGFTDFIDAFYRFHYMDCYEFTKSFDFDMQPGNACDVYDHFRTVGYYYLHWTPFWTDRDTLVPGETWTIGGSGYGANITLPITLGPESFSVTTSDSGDFNLSLTIPSFWIPGVYSLSVAGETSPRKYYVLAGPAIRPVVDTLPITVRAGDSLWVAGTGFHPGETISFYLDSIPLDQSVVANSDNGFLTMLRIPYIAERSYLLVARSTISGNATSQDLVTVTRTVDLEFEDMMPPTYQTPGQCYAQDVSYFWEATWSKQMFVYFLPDSVFVGAAVEFQFSLGHADTFQIAYHASISPDQGRYTIQIDGDSVAMIDGYANTGVWMPLPLPTGPLPLGLHYLAAGPHRMRFTCIGKHDSATNYWVQPDNLVLVPITYLAPTPGTILSNVPIPPHVPTSRSLAIYPDPIEEGTANISLTLASSDAAFFDAQVSVQVYDVLGREISAKLDGELTTNTLSGTLLLPNVLAGTYFMKLTLVASNGSAMELPVQSVVVK
jgi:hypothetical protein